MSPIDLETLDERAEHHALRERRHRRANGKGAAPEAPQPRVLKAELKRYAAEDEREQHDQDRKIDCRNDDGEGERKCRQQAKPAEHEPRLIAIPDRRDRIHNESAIGFVRREAIEDADAQVETVEDDVI